MLVGLGIVLGASVATCQPTPLGMTKPASVQPTPAPVPSPAPRSFSRLFEVPAADGKCTAYLNGNHALAITRKDDGRIRLHDVNGSRTIAELGKGEQAAIGKLGVAVRAGPLFRFFDLDGKLLNEIEHGFGEDGGLASDTPFSDDGRRVLAGKPHGCVVSSVPSFTQLWRGECIGLRFADPRGTRVVWKGRPNLVDVDANTLLAELPFVAISTQNSLLLAQDASKDGDKTLSVVDAIRGQVVSTLQAVQPKLDWEGKTVFSADSSTVLVRDLHDHIRIWDVKSGRHLRDRPPQGEYAGGIALSADGKRFAVGGTPGGVWSVATGAQILAFPHISYDLAFDASGHRFIGGQHDRVHGYDLDTGKKLFEVEARADDAHFTPNGEQVVTSDGECKWVNTASGKVLGHVGGSRFHCDSGQFLSNGRYLCAGNHVYVIDPEHGDIQKQCKSSPGWNTRIRMSANERFLLTRYTLFDRTTCDDVASDEYSFEHQLSPSGNHLATFREDNGSQALWLTDTRDQGRRRLREVGGGPQVFTWVGEQRIAVLTENGLELISASTGATTALLNAEGFEDLSTLAASPDEKRLVSVSNTALVVWNAGAPDDVATQFDLSTIAPPARLANIITQRLADSWERWSFTPDGTRMLLLSETHQLHVVSLLDGAVLGSLGDPSHPIRSYAVSPDGRWLATGTKCDEAQSGDGCQRGLVELRSLSDLKVLGSDQAKHTEVNDVSFNAKSDRLAMLRGDGLTIWSLPE